MLEAVSDWRHEVDPWFVELTCTSFKPLSKPTRNSMYDKDSSKYSTRPAIEKATITKPS
jgi:hypothetical protein